MRLLIFFCALVCATSAQADVWVCSHVVQIGADIPKLGLSAKHLPEVYRFDVSPSEVTTDIGSFKDLHFRIVRDDDRGLVATETTEIVEQDQSVFGPIIFTVAIDKVSGEFAIAMFTATAEVKDGLGEKIAHGRCAKS